MKKILLCALLLITTIGVSNAQAPICEIGPNLSISSPASLVGGYSLGVATWGAPLTTISGDLVLVNDGIATTTATAPYAITYAIHDGCSPIINDITGKIAVIVRGNCTFVIKAQQAIDSGAIAVIIVNHTPGEGVIGIGGSGTFSVPVTMVSNEDGAPIVAALLAGTTVTSSLTSDLQLANDVKIQNCGPIRFRDYNTPISQFAGGNTFSEDDTLYFGTIIYNNGLATQDTIPVNYKFDFTTPAGISSNLFDLNYNMTFATPLANNEESGLRWNSTQYTTLNPAADLRGKYTITYTLPNDDFSPDNTSSQSWAITDSTWSKCEIDADGVLAPTSTIGYGAAGLQLASIYRCYNNVNAAGDLLAIQRMAFRCFATDSLVGKQLLGAIYEWNDADNDSIISITELSNGATSAPYTSFVYTYPDNDGDITRVVELPTNVKLEPGKVYAAVIELISADLYLHSDNKGPEYSGMYGFSIESPLQGYNPSTDTVATAPGRWGIYNVGGFATMIQLGKLDPVGIQNDELSSQINVYPNPSNGIITIEMPNALNTTIEVSNAIGQIVHTSISNAAKTMINLSKQANGIYYIRLNINGQQAFKKITLTH